MTFRQFSSDLTHRLAKVIVAPVALAFGLMALTACSAKTPLANKDYPHVASPAPVEMRQPPRNMTRNECVKTLTDYREHITTDRDMWRYLHRRQIEAICSDPDSTALLKTITGKPGGRAFDPQ